MDIDKLERKYKTIYTMYKITCSTMLKNKAKYIEIIHNLQSKIIELTPVDKLIEVSEEMSEIEKVL